MWLVSWTDMAIVRTSPSGRKKTVVCEILASHSKRTELGKFTLAHISI